MVSDTEASPDPLRIKRQQTSRLFQIASRELRAHFDWKIIGVFQSQLSSFLGEQEQAFSSTAGFRIQSFPTYVSGVRLPSGAEHLCVYVDDSLPASDSWSLSRRSCIQTARASKIVSTGVFTPAPVEAYLFFMSRLFPYSVKSLPPLSGFPPVLPPLCPAPLARTCPLLRVPERLSVECFRLVP